MDKSKVTAQVKWMFSQVKCPKPQMLCESIASEMFLHVIDHMHWNVKCDFTCDIKSWIGVFICCLTFQVWNIWKPCGFIVWIHHMCLDRILITSEIFTRFYMGRRTFHMQNIWKSLHCVYFTCVCFSFDDVSITVHWWDILCDPVQHLCHIFYLYQAILFKLS